MNRFSGEDTPLFDFPVQSSKRFSGQFFGDLGIGLVYLILVLMLGIVAFIGAAMVALVAWGWWGMLMQYPLWTTLITTGTLVLYAGCVMVARTENKHERRR